MNKIFAELIYSQSTLCDNATDFKPNESKVSYLINDINIKRQSTQSWTFGTINEGKSIKFVNKDGNLKTYILEFLLFIDEQQSL